MIPLLCPDLHHKIDEQNQARPEKASQAAIGGLVVVIPAVLIDACPTFSAGSAKRRGCVG